jgi:pyruvate,orthophosphate dikinase
MVYGNMGDDCATGVAFTRDPATGEAMFYGEYLVNAQGEDVVAGTRTPQPVNDSTKSEPDQKTLQEIMPEVYDELDAIYRKLEEHYKEMQDIEFTIQNGRLWMLQTRTGKRTAEAAVRIAVEMVEEGLIDKETAIMRIDPEQLDQLLHPTFDPNADKNVLAKGLPASPGAATGRIVFHADDAEEWVERGEQVILVRIETSPEDIGGMNVAKGILTARGGMTSHAAVVARGMGTCCVAGCGALSINYKAKSMTVEGAVYKEGDWISLDGSAGLVIEGKVPTVEPELSGNFGKLMEWADEVRRLNVRTNADTPHDSTVARNFGAEGIGLCRTEHMFFEGDRIKAVREMILADDEAGRRKALNKLLPYQRDDFYGIFKAMHDLPVTVRTLDPPLHEFLPHDDENQAEMAKEMGITV